MKFPGKYQVGEWIYFAIALRIIDGMMLYYFPPVFKAEAAYVQVNVVDEIISKNMVNKINSANVLKNELSQLVKETSLANVTTNSFFFNLSLRYR